MRYLLVDHITEIDAERSIKGVKNVAMSEDFLEFHFPKNPIMPGVMLLEALAQLTGWLTAVATDFEYWFLLDRIRKCNYYGFAFPGDRVELEVAVLASNATEAAPESSRIGEAEVPTYLAQARVNGKKKVVVEFTGQRVPLADLDEVADRRHAYRVLTRALSQR